MDEWGLSAGDVVELRGLSKLEMNGQRGTVLPLEFPGQAKALGRLAVMMEATGKRLSLKVENLVKVQSTAGAAKTGGDLGEEWSTLLNERGKSMGLPLRCPERRRQHRGAEPEPPRQLVLMNLNLCHLSAEPRGDEIGFSRLDAATSSGSVPDIIGVQESLEGFDLLMRSGYTKLISSAVKAQPVREMVYNNRDTLQNLPADSADKLLVNELYIRSEGSQWEAVESGVEEISSDLLLAGGDANITGPLATRSVVWARLRPRESSEGPFVFVLNAQLSGGALEDQFFVEQLAHERGRQLERVLEVFRQRSGESDLGVILGAAGAVSSACADRSVDHPLSVYFDDVVANYHRVMEDAVSAGLRTTDLLEKRFCEYLCAPSEALVAQGWDFVEGLDGFAVASSCGFLADHLATSCHTPATAERVSLEGFWRRGDGEAQERCFAIKGILEVHPQVQQSEERTQRVGLVELPAIGFGTCFMPEDLNERVAESEFRKMVDEFSESAVLAALSAGVRLFESGNKHMNQQSVGRTLWTAVAAGIVSRPELFIAGRIPRCKDQAEVRREVDMLLRELRMDYVDLLVMDIPPERAPQAWPWLEEVYREGRARYLGITNFDLLGPKVCVEVFRDFLALTEVPPAVYAMEVHPLNNNEEMAECCRGLGIQVMAYSPLGAPHKMEAFMKILTRSDAQDMRPLLKVPDSSVLNDVGQRHGASAAQVALRWNLQRGHCVVPKSFDPAHILENTELFHFSLSQREMSILAGLHKGVRAERFLGQSHVQGKKALPKMTRDAQDACEAILSKIRGPGSSGEGRAEEQMQQELAELYRQQEVLKGKGKGAGAPMLKGGGGKLGPPPMVQSGKGVHFQMGSGQLGAPALGKGTPPIGYAS